MNKKVINLYKPIGLTPLQTINKFKEQNPSYKEAVIGYAGRLDPLAEGVLLILIGEENKNQKEYLKLPKEYEFEVLFGFATDTYDILGLITDHKSDDSKKHSNHEIEKSLKEFQGKFIQKYPPYSSPKVDGKSLFKWSREHRLHEIEIPQKEREIYDIKLLKIYKINKRDLKDLIFKRVKRVKGNFRQEEILRKWDKYLNEYRFENLITAKCYISCSSGTYVRSIAKNLGDKLSTPSLALSIKRTRVGNFRIKDSIRLQHI